MPLLTGLATLVLVAAVALAVSQRLVQRITDAQQQVQQIALGKLDQVKIAGPDDQLTSLTQSVNSMANELRSMWRTIRETERSISLGASISAAASMASRRCTSPMH